VSQLHVPLLLHLRRQQDRWIPPGTLSERFDLPIAAVWQEIDRLSQFGFRIQVFPHQGVRYVGPAERLCPDLIEHEMDTRVIGRPLHIYESCSSTNDLALAAAAGPTAHGSVFVAEFQTAGRGRQGATWFCPPRSGLLYSALLLDGDRPSTSRLLTSMAGTAVAEVVREATDLDARIKWPNDVRVGTAKIAGVLVESRRGASVLGIGLNVNTAATALPPELRGQAASLRSLTGQVQDRSQLVVEVCRRLDQYYGWLCECDTDDRFWSRWADLTDFAGSRVLVDLGDRRLPGRIVDFSHHDGVIFAPDVGGPRHIHPSRILTITP